MMSLGRMGLPARDEPSGAAGRMKTCRFQLCSWLTACSISVSGSSREAWRSSCKDECPDPLRSQCRCSKGRDGTERPAEPHGTVRNDIEQSAGPVIDVTFNGLTLAMPRQLDEDDLPPLRESWQQRHPDTCIHAPAM